MSEDAEHLARCKARALEYLDDGDKASAVASILSDLKIPPGSALSMLGMWSVINGTEEDVRRFIAGFN